MKLDTVCGVSGGMAIAAWGCGPRIIFIVSSITRACWNASGEWQRIERVAPLQHGFEVMQEDGSDSARRRQKCQCCRSTLTRGQRRSVRRQSSNRATVRPWIPRGCSRRQGEPRVHARADNADRLITALGNACLRWAMDPCIVLLERVETSAYHLSAVSKRHLVRKAQAIASAGL